MRAAPAPTPARNVCFTSYLLLKVLAARKPCPWRYLQVDSSLPDLRGIFASATNVSNFPSIEFVLDTRPFASVLQTHSLYEWGPRVVLHCFSLRQHACLSLQSGCVTRVVIPYVFKEKPLRLVSPLLLFGASGHSCWNFSSACKLIRWWEVP